MHITFLGLSITSSWGNGHATIYRGLVQALVRRGHRVTFLERDKPWYAQHRDLPDPDASCYGDVFLYQSLDDLRDRFAPAVQRAELSIVGSYVPDGVAVGEWVCETAEGVPAFYDIDTPVTLAKLARGDYEYLTPELVRRYRLYLTFTGGPTLRRLEVDLRSPAARPLYCCVDPDLYFPASRVEENPHMLDARRLKSPRRGGLNLDLGYMGTYSDDRQPPLERLLLEPARRWGGGRFMVAGPQYPAGIDWPGNVERVEHLPPAEHRAFYNSQRFTLNITRADMVAAGYAPSVRLFEAAACGTPIISDRWAGLDTFFPLDEAILIADTPEDTLRYLRELPESQRRCIAQRARSITLENHTADARAAELEAYVREVS